MLFHAANALPCPQCPSVAPMLFQLNKRGGGVARHGDALLFRWETCPVEPSGRRVCDFCLTHLRRIYTIDKKHYFMNKGKLLIFSAPSGSGKSTLVQWLMAEHPELNLHFSISCTTRQPRGTERDGVEYFFLTPESFRERIQRDEFVEYEEVYKDKYYGTLKSQVTSQTDRGENVVFDVDVKGGCNIKSQYGDRALSVFIQPPSLDELRRRLVGRATDSPEVIEQRLAKAGYEMTFAPQFDVVIVNDNLEKAKEETLKTVRDFLDS